MSDICKPMCSYSHPSPTSFPHLLVWDFCDGQDTVPECQSHLCSEYQADQSCEYHAELWGISDRTSFTLNCLKRNLKFQSTTPTPSVNSPTSSKGSAYHGSRQRAKARGIYIYQRKRRLHCCSETQVLPLDPVLHLHHLARETSSPSCSLCI